MKIADIREWLPVIGLSLATFLFLTSETLPVGLLPEIAQSLDKSEASTGLLVTGYAWIVALLSLPMTLLTAKINRRPLLVILLVVFVTGNFVASQSHTYSTIFTARVIVAFSHSVFWSITAPLAARLSPKGRYTIGLGMISGGVAIGTVLGVPLATLIGQNFGWRTAFFSITATGVLIIIALLRLLPTLPSENAGTFRSLPALVRNKPLIAAYLVTVFSVTGYFTVFTYLVPFIKGILQVPAKQVSGVLLLFGISGLIGIYTASKYMDGHTRRLLLLGMGTVMITLSLLGLMSSLPPALPLIILWSAGLSTFYMSLQGWVLRLSPAYADAAVSIYSGIFNVGIGSGALIGGQIVNHGGLPWLALTGAGFIIPAFALVLIFSKNKIR